MRYVAALLGTIFLTACSSGAAEPRAQISVLTALPLFWGEARAQDIITSEDQRAPVIRHLSETYSVKPLDHIDAASLSKSPLLMMAQPRGLAPEELVDLDEWVRGGGRVIIFADPLLVWPSRHALGDVRRAPPVTLLDPLLAHWGIVLESPPGNAPLAGKLNIGENTASGAGMGLFTSDTPSCQPSKDRRWISCTIGTGHVTLVGDADILDLESHPANTAAIDALIAYIENR